MSLLLLMNCPLMLIPLVLLQVLLMWNLSEIHFMLYWLQDVHTVILTIQVRLSR